MESGLHFPKSSIILLLLCACWASCSALDISIISRSRWKVRSRDIGGSSDLLPLSIDSSPRSPKLLMSALMFPTFPCKRRRVSWSCNALLQMAGDPPGYMDDDGKELESPLPSRMKYSSPSRSRMGPDCCCCCWEFWVWGAGTRRAPPGLSIARHSQRGKKATSRITVVPNKLSFMSGYQQESEKENKCLSCYVCIFNPSSNLKCAA